VSNLRFLQRRLELIACGGEAKSTDFFLARLGEACEASVLLVRTIVEKCRRRARA